MEECARKATAQRGGGRRLRRLPRRSLQQLLVVEGGVRGGVLRRAPAGPRSRHVFARRRRRALGREVWVLRLKGAQRERVRERRLARRREDADVPQPPLVVQLRLVRVASAAARPVDALVTRLRAVRQNQLGERRLVTVRSGGRRRVVAAVVAAVRLEREGGRRRGREVRRRRGRKVRQRGGRAEPIDERLKLLHLISLHLLLALALAARAAPPPARPPREADTRRRRRRRRGAAAAAHPPCGGISAGIGAGIGSADRTPARRAGSPLSRYAAS